MISDEVKQAIEDVVAADNMCYLSREKGKQIAAAVEAKLSPKHPKKGGTCEVWDDNQRPHFLAAYLRRADGNGAFHFVGRGEEDKSRRWDHYREIPTAKDALVVVNEKWGVVDLNTARQAIQALIDNAKEG